MMRTNVANVYAVGDVNGKVMLAHTAYREAEVAVNPNCKVVTKQQRNHCKCSNPTYEMMIACIQMQPNAKELMDEFMRVRNFAHISRKGYNIVRSWFMAQNLMDFDPIHTFCDKIELAA